MRKLEKSAERVRETAPDRRLAATAEAARVGLRGERAAPNLQARPRVVTRWSAPPGSPGNRPDGGLLRSPQRMQETLAPAFPIDASEIASFCGANDFAAAAGCLRARKRRE